jgi:hypothetical protein
MLPTRASENVTASPVSSDACQSSPTGVVIVRGPSASPTSVPPASDARCPRLSGAGSVQGLPISRRGGLKKLVKLRLGTVNVGTMTGRSREVADTLRGRRIDIACVQETKWKGSKAKFIGDGFKLFYSGLNSTRNGVGIIVSATLQKSIVEVSRISDRLMSLKIDAGALVLRVISCYAPQTGCSDIEKDAFWESLDAHLRSIDHEEHIVLGGDLNGHVGLDRDGYERVHGGNGLGDRNINGVRVLDCAEAHDLAIANTFFKKRHSHKVTYISGAHETQIDYWLIRRSDLKLVKDAKVIPSTVISQQHQLLVLDVRFDVGQKSRTRVTTTERVKWWKLQDNKEALTTALEENMNLSQPVCELWEQLTSSIHDVASNILGKTQPGKQFMDKQVWWWNSDVQGKVNEKKIAFKIWRKSRNQDDRRRYVDLKLKAKQAVAIAKSAHYDQLYEDLEAPTDANKVYRLAKDRHRATQDIVGVRNIKDKNHNVLRDTDAILQRWNEHFEGISNEEFPHAPIQSANPIPGPVPLICGKEVEVAINKMKNGKATGPDDIPAEIWKLMGQNGVNILTDLFNGIVGEGKVPDVWLRSVTVPIWKGKGDVAECTNYRPIRLLCHAMKIFERIIDSRLREIAKIKINQSGFVKGCGTTDPTHAARLLLEKHREKDKTVHAAFLDLEKAFDRVPHDLIWHSLRSHMVPEAYVDWVKLLYRNVTSVVRCSSGISPPFPISVGVHQGSALSPFLFILCMDTITADIQSPHPWCLLYADDVFLACETRGELQFQTEQWKTQLENFGMRLNIEKTEYLECGPQTNGTIVIDGKDLKKVDNFKYLGTVINNAGESSNAVRARIKSAWAKWRQVTGILCDRRMPVKLKGKIYKTVVRPVAMFGSACYPITSNLERAFHAMEMRMLRWSLGLTRWDHVENVKVRERLGVAAITDKLRETRLRWYGHVMRSNVNSVAATAQRLEVQGRRPRGRPKKRWMDQVVQDMATVGAVPEDVYDRSKWRRLINNADPACRD